jgi:hypothetical protein
VGVTSQPAVAMAAVRRRPPTVVRGVICCDITIVNLLAKRFARRVVTPSPMAGTTGSGALVKRLVCNRAVA